jgi:hypothetical protein
MLVYVSRSEWGATQATENFIANRYSASAAEKTTVQVHHTASIDRLDHTPNRWTFERARAYMRSLQTARPELGPLPYSMNLAVSEDLSTVWMFEGRGFLKVGAHTAGHNRDGVGYGIFGNFDLRDDQAALRAVEAIEADVTRRRSAGLVNLGSVKNPQGWNAWGHRDSSAKSCPGNHLYPLLANFQLDQGDDMAWTKPGDPVADLADAQAVFGYQGNAIFSGADFAYDENDPRFLDERLKVIVARVANILMVHDARIGAEEAESGGTTGTVDQTARDAAAKANQALSRIKTVI